MSIPKNPRQIMINLMYLVLTALLALNVSTEIFNAFDMVDHSLIESNKALDNSNEKLPGIIKDRAKKSKELEKYAERVDPARTYSNELTTYINKIIDTLIDQSGNKNGRVDDGDYKVFYGEKQLIGKKNKDVTTRLLVDEGKGEELKQKLMEYREKFIGLIDSADQESFADKIALEIDDQSWREARDKDSWSDFNFRQMPLKATLPIFRKFINDTKNTESSVLNYLLGEVGGDDVVFEKFKVVSSPTKSYVIRGEQFETDVFLSAAAGEQSNTDIQIMVNGRPLDLEDGVAHYTVNTNDVGVKTYTATAKVTNPVTGETDTYEETFEYEVGRRSVTVTADKMNVFYIGVDNPVTISAAGVPTSKLNINADGAGIELNHQSGSQYIVNVSRPGEATITISGGGMQATSFPFRVKRIPNPEARLSNKSGGEMGNGTFKAQQGVIAKLINFDFDARCRIVGFRLVRVAPRQDAEIANNNGATYNSEAKTLVNKAKPGDRYFYENVKAKCPGDKVSRKINDMVFNIQ